MKIVLTCEHSTNYVPKKYMHLFNPKSILKTHEGYDIGALNYFRYLEAKLDCYSQEAKVSRLLIEMNRKLGSKSLFSGYSQNLGIREKTLLTKKYYETFRQPVLNYCLKNITEYKILHLSIHTFTRVLDKARRDADVGILYNPEGSLEKRFASLLKQNLDQSTQFKTRLNYPYLGTASGHHVTFLRKELSSVNYLGLEIEVCNDQFESHNIENNTEAICESIIQAINAFRG